MQNPVGGGRGPVMARVQGFLWDDNTPRPSRLREELDISVRNNHIMLHRIRRMKKYRLMQIGEQRPVVTIARRDYS
jgi:hypothetical protein